MGKFYTLGDVSFKLSNSFADEALLKGSNFSNFMDFLDTLGSELNIGGEERNSLLGEEGAFNKGGLDDVFLPRKSFEEAESESGAGKSHRQGGTTLSVLGLDNFVTTKLNTVGEGFELFVVKLKTLDLGKEGNNGGTGVATDDRNLNILGVFLHLFGDESRGANNIKGSHAKETASIVYIVLLEDFSNDGDSGINGVGDDKEVSLGAVSWKINMMPMADAYLAQAAARSRTMEALMLKRSSRVMPGFLGTPAGMTTTSQPSRACLRPSFSGTNPLT